MSSTPNGSDDDTILAAERALGVLSPEERRAADARAATDPRFASLVAEWEARLGDLAAETPPERVPAHVWDGVEGALFGATTEPRRGLWNSLPFWRGLAAAATLVAGAVVAAVLLGMAPGGIVADRATRLVATLQPADPGPTFLAGIDAGRGRLVIRAIHPGGDARRVPELWLIPGDGIPRSLGVIAGAGQTVLDIPDALRPLARRDAVLAVSLEPEGGSPTGAPTGPVVATGSIEPL